MNYENVGPLLAKINGTKKKLYVSENNDDVNTVLSEIKLPVGQTFQIVPDPEKERSILLVIGSSGSGKSYLGFILYDLIGKLQSKTLEIIGIELRKDLVEYCQDLAIKLEFKNMAFHLLSTDEAIQSNVLPPTVDLVTALHACNTATDDAIRFALAKKVEHLVLVPCCQAEVASFLRKNKSLAGEDSYLAQIWRHPIHSREFGSHVTNVLRTLQLESHGYKVTVTELVGWEHSMKNELIIASKGLNSKQQNQARADLNTLLKKLQLEELVSRFN